MMIVNWEQMLGKNISVFKYTFKKSIAKFNTIIVILFY